MRVGPGVQQADEVHADVGGPGALGLLEEDEVLGGRGTAAAVLLGPVDARVAGVEQHALPAGVPHAAGLPVVAVGLGPELGSTSPSQARQLGAELLLVGRVPEVHRCRERI